MRVLLVYPEFPHTFWGIEYLRDITGNKSRYPPLGLITVAAMLPTDWEIELLDLNLDPLDPARLQWADMVMLSAMNVQEPSLMEVLELCRKLEVTSVLGGPFISSVQYEVPADIIIQGEAETSLGAFLEDIKGGISALQKVYPAQEKPDLSLTPVPRFELLGDRYLSQSIQFSRGCPFLCEFCDIIELFGRVPRAKSSEQILAELQAIYDTGFRGTIFIVDDNFIGNKKKAAVVLRDIAVWQRDHDWPFWLGTEADVRLGTEDELLDLMVRAGMDWVFLGIETPNEASLRETQKTQNMRFDLTQTVHRLQEKGIEVYAGFIIGFDSDDETIFERQINFIREARIATAMVGTLGVSPGTQLERRLEREGRLLPGVSYHNGDVFSDLLNFKTKLPVETLIRGWMQVLTTIYNPKEHFECIFEMTRARGFVEGSKSTELNRETFTNLLRVFYLQGIKSDYRWQYWRLIARVLWSCPSKIDTALCAAVRGHQMIMYTRELQARLEDMIERRHLREREPTRHLVPKTSLPILNNA